MARSITKAAVKEARAKDLKLELLNSDRLKVGIPYRLAAL